LGQAAGLVLPGLRCWWCMERLGISRATAGAKLHISWATSLLWSLTAVVLASLLLIAIPLRFAELSAVCLEPPCESASLSAQGHAVLQQIGLAAATYAAYLVAVEILVALVFLAVSALIMRGQSENRFAVFAAFMLLLFGVGVVTNEVLNTLAPGSAAVQSALQLLNVLGFLSFFIACYLFPDGRFYPRWAKFMAAAWIVFEIPWVFPDLISLPMGLSIPLSLGLIASGILAQVYRYRRHSTPVQRQQTKWVLFGLFIAIAGFVAYGLLPILVPALLEPGHAELLFYGFGRPLAAVTLSMLPVTLAIAMWRYRLWDIDLILSRTFVYAALTGLTIGIYALVAGSLGALFQARGSWLVSLIAAGGVAVLFQPLRLWIQRGINRILFGDRDDPVVVLTRLARMLEATALPGDVLNNIVETIAQALRLPFAAVKLLDEGVISRRVAFGAPQQEGIEFPIVYQGEVLGYLVVAPHEPGEALSPADRSLLESIARQAGPAIYALKLTADLQRSRERLVVGREEERRRIRRDLHDGLGPMLASQSLLLETVENLIHQDLATAEGVITELRHQTQTALSDVRQLIYNLRPPSLDDLGLVGALQEEINRHSGRDLQMSIHSDPLPPLPAAVEVAIFRIVQEAVTNVVRHAAAHSCEIHLHIQGDSGKVRLLAEIKDDGCGVQPEHSVGVGLESMRERAAELGGACWLETIRGGGTTVRAWVPLNEEG
jgi:signal transduction histidine kinase